MSVQSGSDNTIGIRFVFGNEVRRFKALSPRAQHILIGESVCIRILLRIVVTDEDFELVDMTMRLNQVFQ